MDILFSIVYFWCSKDFIEITKGKRIFKKVRNASKTFSQYVITIFFF